MPERRRARLWIAGILGGAVVATAVYFRVLHEVARHRAGTSRGRGGEERHSVEGLQPGPAGRRHAGSGECSMQRVDPKAGQTKTALNDQDGSQWLETLTSLRGGFSKFSAPARATAAVVACRILDKFSIEPAPARWIEGLQPVHDILSACMEDGESNVRYIALGEVGKLWAFIPGRVDHTRRGRRAGKLEGRASTGRCSVAWPAPICAPASVRSRAWEASPSIRRRRPPSPTWRAKTSTSAVRRWSRLPGAPLTYRGHAAASPS